MAYIPPGRRAQASASSTATTAKPSESEYSLRDITHYFWPDSEFDSLKSTLQASAADPSSLSFIMLFGGANPRWEDDKIIYVKSRLELLKSKSDSLAVDLHTEADTPDSEPVPTLPHPADGGETKRVMPTQPLLIFYQILGPRTISNFRCLGYFKISRLDILKPRTPELVRMMEQKWKPKMNRYGRPIREQQRDPKAWQDSLSVPWAAIQFEKDEKAQSERGMPDIPRADLSDSTNRRGSQAKSVNDLLKEMRLKDAEVAPAKEALAADNKENTIVQRSD